MSQENVELVRRAYEAFNTRDYERLMTMVNDDVVWRFIGGFADLVGPELRGRDEVGGWFVESNELLGNRGEIEDIRESGERVVVIVRMAGAGGVSGAPTMLRFSQVFSFRDGLISAADNYYEPSGAFEAEGLPPPD